MTTSDLDAAIGWAVRTHRRRKRMTQADLAAALDISFQQVCNYERGKDRISGGKLWLAAKAIGVPVESFFEGCE